MAKEYYNFVAGLPVQTPDDTKLLLTPMMFLHNAEDHLDLDDFNQLELLLLPNDITNVVHILHHENHWSDECTVSKDEWLEALEILKQNTKYKVLNKKLFKKHIPIFMLEYLHKITISERTDPDYIMYKELFSSFYTYIESIDNKFLKEWF